MGEQGQNITPERRVLFGVALVCFGNLLLEVVLTRIFSATMYYHFTFLAIAVALFGMGASGVYVYVHSARYTADRVIADLATNARRFAAATVFSLIYVLANPIQLGVGMGKGPSLGREAILPLLLFNAVTVLPFFFAGMVVSLAVLHFRRDISRVYFYDLCGAALAAAAVGILLGVFGAPSLVLVVAVLATGAALLFERPGRLYDWVPLAAAVVLLLGNLAWPVIAVSSGKGVRNERLVFEKWNAFSRVTVEKHKNGQLNIAIDASAKTRLAHTKEIARQKQRPLSALAYVVHPRGTQRALIIGPGGGPDIVNALAAGVRWVTGVEINPIIVDDIMKGEFAFESGRLYMHPKVRIITDEGRSYIRRTSHRFHVIQATLVDTWAATASGAFALTENTLYTLEAFVDYYRHLVPGGVVTMTRWLGGRDPEIARLLVLACAGLTELCVPVSQLRKHLVLAKRGSVATLIAGRDPLTDAQLDRIEAAAKHRFEIILTPRSETGHRHFQSLVNAGPDGDYTRNNRRFDLSPPTDDRPFFFYFNRPDQLFRWKNLTGDMLNPAVWILVAFGISICALSIIFILVPLLVHRRDVWRSGGERALPRRLTGLLHFASIGLGFIILEIALMQKLGLFLGHPSYGLIVVLFAVLIATAAGARLSALVPPARRVWFSAGATVSVALLGIIYSLVLDGMLHNWITLVLSARIAVAIAIVALAGTLMGLVLPLGIGILDERDHELIPWCWGINGAASVIGTVLATIIAIHFGFNATLRTGAYIYVVAGLSIVAVARLRPTRGASAAD